VSLQLGLYLIALSDDIAPNPGPVASPCGKENFDNQVFNKRDLYFVHINTRSLIPSLDEIRLLARKTKAACICTTETWLDDSVPDSEVHIDNY